LGLILDSSVLIAAERKGHNARQALTEIALRVSGEDVALSVVTVIELMHGAVRADSPSRNAMRRQFLNELLTAVPVHPVTVPIALRTGQLDGENTAKGIRLALADLLIGVTALELGYGVLTGNVRHFERIPGLTVTTL
jgi:predicted nucleic acid-binding protein